MKLIAQGAEGMIVLEKDAIVKERVAKGYRYPVLDEQLRKIRTRKEAKLLEKASKVIDVPKLLALNERSKIIAMEFISGKRLSDWLDKLTESFSLCEKIGVQIGKMHDAGIIHGDLTTSNMILGDNDKIYFIDFGLGYESDNVEDKAVDLHVLKEALEARHYTKFNGLFGAVLKGYSKSKNAKYVLRRLEKVEREGDIKDNISLIENYCSF